MANMTLWNPEDDFSQMRRMMNRLMGGSLLGGDPFRELLHRASPAALLNFTPPVEIEDRGTDFRVQVDLPGVREEDVHITVAGNVLTIRGEKKYERGTMKGKVVEAKGKAKAGMKQEEEEGQEEGNGGEGQPIFSERAYGRFERIITLPDDVDPGKVEATFKNGVLEIVLQRREESKPREIPVKIQH